MNRREFLNLAVHTAIAGGALGAAPAVWMRDALGTPAAVGLSDSALQPKFVELAPNALDPGFLFRDLNHRGGPVERPNFRIRARQTRQETGVIDPRNGKRLKTKVWGYGANTVSWPGQTFQVVSTSDGGADETVVRWVNELQVREHLLPIDPALVLRAPQGKFGQRCRLPAVQH